MQVLIQHESKFGGSGRIAERIDQVSAGGGAMLELIEKGDLPGWRPS
jgi:3-phosphoglycerate kinase